MSMPGKTSKLDPYRAEIVALRRQRRTLQDIARHLAREHGVRVALSTLSTYLDQAEQGSVSPSLPPEPGRTTPEQEHFLAQAEVFVELQTSMRMVVERLSDVVEAVRALNREGQQRHETIQSALQATERSSETAQRAVSEQQSLLTRMLEAPRGGPSIPPAGAGPALATHQVRQIWRRAFWVTGLLWAAIVLGGYVLFGPMVGIP